MRYLPVVSSSRADGFLILTLLLAVLLSPMPADADGLPSGREPADFLPPLMPWDGKSLEILSRTEYVEAYVMEPLARAMLEDDPELAAEFRARLENDSAFAADERARLQWFYERSPFFDSRYRLYPVARAVRE
jgi:hypothetical protein